MSANDINVMQMSADVDRFPDRYIARQICPALRNKDGQHPTVEEVRISCHNAKLKGYDVLPVCSNPDAKGWCRCPGGHQ